MIKKKKKIVTLIEKPHNLMEKKQKRIVILLEKIKESR